MEEKRNPDKRNPANNYRWYDKMIEENKKITDKIKIIHGKELTADTLPPTPTMTLETFLYHWCSIQKSSALMTFCFSLRKESTLWNIEMHINCHRIDYNQIQRNKDNNNQV